MSVGTASDSSRWKQNYEKIILIVVLIGLMASAAYLFLKVEQVKKVLAAMDSHYDAVAKQPVEPVDQQLWQRRLSSVKTPFQTVAQSNQMMVSERRIRCISPTCGKPIPYHAEECPFCGRKQPEILDITEIDDDSDGIPNAFELAHDMNPFDPEDALLDTDGDGFSALEEFSAEKNEWETDPSDPTDFPSPIAKLRVLRVEEKPFILLFQGVQELADGKRFLLNMRSLQRSHFVKIGDVVEGYEVVSFEEETGKRPEGGEIDRSVLTLKKDEDLIPLTKNVDRVWQERMARLILLIDRSTYTLKRGETLDLKGKKYKVIDIRHDGVLIRDIQAGKDTLINRLSDNERSRLRGGVRTGSGRAGAPSVNVLRAASSGGSSPAQSAVDGTE